MRPDIQYVSDLARALDCEIITRRAVVDLQSAHFRDSQEIKQLRKENAKLRAALVYEPWWRRGRA